MRPYILTKYDKNGIELWQEKHESLSSCLNSIVAAHHAKAKTPLFCGVSSVDVDGVIHQLSLTEESLLGSSFEGCEYLAQLCEF